MNAEKLKNDILDALTQSMEMLGAIPVTAIDDCRRKTAIHDNLEAIHKVFKAMNFNDKEDENDNKEEEEHDGTQADCTE